MERHVMAQNIQQPSYQMCRRDLFTMVGCMWANGDRKLADSQLIVFLFTLLELKIHASPLCL